MDKERIRNEAEAFFEWPTHDKTHVTTTSMLIFAGVIADMAAAEAVQSEQAWRKDAEAVLKKMAGEGWITHALQAEGVSGISTALLSLKREARGVLSPPNEVQAPPQSAAHQIIQEDDLLTADRASNVNKAERAIEREAERALDLQIKHQNLPGALV